MAWVALRPFFLPLSQNALSQITKPKTPPSKTSRCTRSTLLAMGGTEKVSSSCMPGCGFLDMDLRARRLPREKATGWRLKKGRYLKSQAGPPVVHRQDPGGLLLARALGRRSAKQTAPANGRLVSLSGRAGRVKNFAGFGATLPDTSHTAMPKPAHANLQASATTSKILARKIRLKRKNIRSFSYCFGSKIRHHPRGTVSLPLSQNALSQITKPKTPPSKTSRCTRSTLLAMGGTEKVSSSCMPGCGFLDMDLRARRLPREKATGWRLKKGRYLKSQAGPLLSRNLKTNLSKEMLDIAPSNLHPSDFDIGEPLT